MSDNVSGTTAAGDLIDAGVFDLVNGIDWDVVFGSFLVQFLCSDSGK
ncbi:putative holin [Citrobacter sp. Marseille-Q3906]|nr:putative holin [Citrobacter sp. Marseille-Q3906]